MSLFSVCPVGGHAALEFLGCISCLFAPPMRVLVVLPDPIATESIRERCSPLLADGHEIAVCFVLPAGEGLRASLETQRKITTEIRQAFGASAETIPVFVISGLEGDGVDDCARAWGATDVQL